MTSREIIDDIILKIHIKIQSNNHNIIKQQNTTV